MFGKSGSTELLLAESSWRINDDVPFVACRLTVGALHIGDSARSNCLGNPGLLEYSS